jgi:mono/diheme cytochrome c family protein
MEYPMTRAIGLTIVAALALAASPSAAQEKAPRLGQAAAERLCAECHAVRGGDLRSPFSSAPTFPTIAAVPGMTATALQVALQTSHRSMPNIVLQPDERQDIVTYILSLKQ